MLTDDSLAPTAFGEPEPQPELLSYDDSVAYEDQVGSTSLADRIGRGKIYLLEDAAPTTNLKVCSSVTTSGPRPTTPT